MIESIWKAQVISPGLTVGKSLMLDQPIRVRQSEQEFDAETELMRFHKQVDHIAGELSEMFRDISTEIDSKEAEIIQTHQMILTDEGFRKKVINLITEEFISVDAAVERVMQNVYDRLASSPNEYMQERAGDFIDLANYFRTKSLQKFGLPELEIFEDTILVVHELFPSTVLACRKAPIKGIICEKCTSTSHAAILAKSLGLPVVNSSLEVVKSIIDQDQIILDAYEGKILVNPQKTTLEHYKKRMSDIQKNFSKNKQGSNKPCQTIDGIPISLAVNIESLDELSSIPLTDVDEIGLFRTEFLFMFNQTNFPTFEQQKSWYQEVVKFIDGRPITFRILDVGGDKFLPYFSMGVQDNPYLGLRAHRIFKYHPEIFETQLKAILSAAEGNPIKILYPMINDLQELDFLNRMLKAVDSGADNIDVGIMIETPAAVFQIEKLMQHVDFVSIGTNDLVQYVLTVDRNNQNVMDYYQPFQPVILQMIRKVVQAGDKFGKPVSICGEIAADTRWTPLLLGLGIRSYSMAPLLVPAVKKQIQALKLHNCRNLARKVLQADYLKDVMLEMESFWKRNNNL